MHRMHCCRKRAMPMNEKRATQLVECNLRALFDVPYCQAFEACCEDLLSSRVIGDIAIASNNTKGVRQLVAQIRFDHTGHSRSRNLSCSLSLAQSVTEIKRIAGRCLSVTQGLC